MDLPHRTDGAALNQLNDAAVVVAGVNLRAHLRDALVFGGGFRHLASLGDGVRQRLFAVDVLACLESGQRDNGVVVVGRGDDDRLDVLAVDDAAPVAVEDRLGETLPRRRSKVFVHVAQGDDVGGGVGRLVEVVGALIVDADDGDVEAFAGRGLFGSGLGGAGEAGRGAGLEKVTAAEA